MAEAGNGHTPEPDSKASSSLSVNSSSGGSPVTENENDSFLFFSYLDEIEDRIESLRRHAIALSQEKSSLLLVLSQLKEESMTAALKKDEFQEICVNMERLRTRCNAVDIKVETIRSPEQQEGYIKVSSLVDELEESLSLTDDKASVIKRANTYLNACSSDASTSGAMDFKFQGMILDCVIDDQKSIRYRLENIVNNGIRSSQQSARSESSVYTGGDHSENCIKPSAISSAVKNNPHFDEVCEPSTNELASSEKVKVDNSVSSNNHNENIDVGS